MRYTLSLVTGVLCILGNMLGGYWVWANPFLVLVVFVALDWLIKPDTSDNSDENSLIPDVILLLHVLLHTLAVVSLLYQVGSGALQGYALAGGILSTGLNSGISGIISAHELIHRKQRWMQNLGIWNLLLVHYTHFYVEHIRNHHKNVGTAADPATARKGESLYAFFVRTIPGQFISAWRIASENKSWIQNVVLMFLLMQLVLDIFIFFVFGKMVLLVFLLQSVIAILLLEYVNYIEHYGLERAADAKFDITHAWQSNTITSRFTLLELSRHSDHHLKASKPYHTLVSHDGSPKLPGGYFGMFYICLIPVLWFRVIDSSQ